MPTGQTPSGCTTPPARFPRAAAAIPRARRGLAGMLRTTTTKAKATVSGTMHGRWAQMLALCLSTILGGLLSLNPVAAATAPSEESATTVQLDVNASAAGTPFPHFWEEAFGAGHSVLALRADYQRDLTMVKQATEFKYLRFHDILGAGTGLFHLGKDGKPIYNFTYVDQIYDTLLAHGAKPFVELSSMPPDLQANPKAPTVFTYKFRTSPPKSYALWDGLIKAFAQHLVARYGINEVASWYFEVWNEPDIPFWSGKPAQATYFTLYAHTARDLKSVSPRIRVGGPATSAAKWIPAFLSYVHAQHLPLDFVSTHAYGDACKDVAKVHAQILVSPFPHIPFILSEFNASAFNRPDITDSAYMGPYLGRIIRDCAGNVDMMSYWTFSDVFEEQGVPPSPFYGGFGLVAEGGIPKPAFNAFALLHKLGHVQLPTSRLMPAIVTRRQDGSLVIALWNYAPPVSTKTHYVPGNPVGADKHFDLRIDGIRPDANATLWQVDRQHGDVVATFDKMGRPDYPSTAQFERLRTAARLSPPEHITLHGNRLEVNLPPYGLAVIEIPATGTSKPDPHPAARP